MMFTRTFFAVGVAIALFSAVAAAQDEGAGGLKKHTAKPLATSSAPVTESEARAAFAKAQDAVRNAVRLSGPPPAVVIPNGDSPVRREQVVAEMAVLYREFLPKVKLTPAPVKYDPAVLRMAGTELASLNMLIRLGAVARIGPLATGPKDSLTVPQFGDAVGFFLARMALITHMPTNKWTPELEPQGG